MPSANVDNGSIHYLDRGTGSPLVLLPGLGFTSEIWAPQIDTFAEDHRVIAIDPRGVGGSSRLDVARDILARQAKDIAAVLEKLHLDRVVVCGVSYGGVLAQRFVVDFPERVVGLVTVDSFSDTRPRSGKEALNRVLLDACGWFWLFPGIMRPGIRYAYARWPHTRDFMLSGLATMRRWETVKIRYALNRVSLTERLGEVTSPGLAVSADAPQLLPMSQRIGDALPKGRVAEISDSFDPSNRCQPQEFNRVLREFLQEIAW